MARRPTSADSPGSWTTPTSSTPSVVTTPTSGRSNCRCPRPSTLPGWGSSGFTRLTPKACNERVATGNSPSPVAFRPRSAHWLPPLRRPGHLSATVARCCAGDVAVAALRRELDSARIGCRVAMSYLTWTEYAPRGRGPKEGRRTCVSDRRSSSPPPQSRRLVRFGGSGVALLGDPGGREGRPGRCVRRALRQAEAMRTVGKDMGRVGNAVCGER